MDVIKKSEEVFNKTEFIHSLRGLHSSSRSLGLGGSNVSSLNSMKKLVPTLNADERQDLHDKVETYVGTNVNERYTQD